MPDLDRAANLIESLCRLREFGLAEVARVLVAERDAARAERDALTLLCAKAITGKAKFSRLFVDGTRAAEALTHNVFIIHDGTETRGAGRNLTEAIRAAAGLGEGK